MNIVYACVLTRRRAKYVSDFNCFPQIFSLIKKTGTKFALINHNETRFIWIETETLLEYMRFSTM